jgi:outer membrane protein
MPEVDMNGVARAIAAALLAVCCALPAHAKEVPLWEVGLGAGAIAFEDYRGSNTTHAYPLPVPYVVYNGKFLKADRDGVRGTLFNQNWLEINLSFNLTTPVRNDRERSGMPDLRSTVEIGPSFDFHLFRSDNRRVKFDLRMPLRYAATVESSPRIIGWTFSPRFNVDLRDPFGLPGWNLGLLAGPLFADHRYHDYF